MSEIAASSSLAALITLCGVALFGWSGVCLLLGFGAERALGPTRRIYRISHSDRQGQLVQETIGTVRFLAIASVAFGILLAVVRHAPNDAARFTVTFLVCWAGFEAYYWALHRAMHTRVGYRFHRYHHDSRVMTPMTGYSMSVVEALGWLVGLTGPLLLLSLAMPISIEGWLAYMAYHVSGNVVGHSNVELMGRAVGTRWLSWLAHPITYHAMHHARVHNHYGFGSTFMDRWLGTEWSDWPALHLRVLAGRGPGRLTERA
jgi:sterol desaturase/sphingolipid hydroxylase (fatty acid hydroxylase superfamily)